ncbi:hypothetical protein GOHSU_42_00240 [Gordonia hirsuta DSM 44140 = NBRC 16056]|uniref:Methyltransferase type 11 domain-containing protein n=1 Tax=Gordonia hirsuta DSM 44140 = NBRC 16056 TaxID=1121927 RepID=L7LEN9_9ACTN|nr:class I SAM-dependent methyltransferase [Gordonia hirsuta]GAC58532.1 hypothetical protein GOHSU_42_00240 [Gordonia hirsuta DSM 44140 = NBRC 16056]
MSSRSAGGERHESPNWFLTGSGDYAAHRPTYPPELAVRLADLAPARNLAVDVGCGSGQFTTALAEQFERVLGLDPSADQIAHAALGAGVEYRVAPAEKTGLPDGCADLITVAQAAHWFDLPAFYAEARRIAADGAVLALITYGAVQTDPAVTQRFSAFHDRRIAPYWPPQRRHVDQGYALLEFPFEQIALSLPPIERNWTLTQFLDYLDTWSAVRRADQTGARGLVQEARTELAPLWGAGPRPVRWPVTVLAARLNR